MLVNAPFGLKPVFHPTGQMRPIALDGGIASAYASNIFLGDPVAYTAGAGTIAVTNGATAMVGSFAGCEYVDTFGRPQVSAFWAASTALFAGTTCRAYFHTDVFLVYAIQAAGPLAQTAIGNQADMTVSAGSTTTGVSAAVISTTLKGSGVQGILRILGLYPDINNAWGDAFTVVLVNIANHQFAAAKTAI